MAASGDKGGDRFLRSLERDADPGVHQVLLLRHAQPQRPVPQPREAHPGGEGTLRVQVLHQKYSIGNIEIITQSKIWSITRLTGHNNLF